MWHSNEYMYGNHSLADHWGFKKKTPAIQQGLVRDEVQVFRQRRMMFFLVAVEKKVNQTKLSYDVIMVARHDAAIARILKYGKSKKILKKDSEKGICTLTVESLKRVVVNSDIIQENRWGDAWVFYLQFHPFIDYRNEFIPCGWTRTGILQTTIFLCAKSKN